MNNYEVERAILNFKPTKLQEFRTSTSRKELWEKDQFFQSDLQRNSTRELQQQVKVKFHPFSLFLCRQRSLFVKLFKLNSLFSYLY
jgi:hypothetical protein